jgi:hydroxymethylglutaryl-CoA reductase
MSNSFSGFYKLSVDERRSRVADWGQLEAAELQSLCGEPGLPMEVADQMVENAIGSMTLPTGVCVNLNVNGVERIVPMSVEESSVVAAASHGCKLLTARQPLEVTCTEPLMIGQMQFLDVPDLDAAEAAIEANRERIFDAAAAFDPLLVKLGGGPKDLEVRRLMPMEDNDPIGPMLILHLVVNVKDAMGANAINTMCEGITPMLEELTGGRARLRILSNLADRRLVTVCGVVPFEALAGKGNPVERGVAVAEGVQEASIFAERDPYRAATHNKGIMNGIDAVLLATGQDWRAIEAGAHAYAAKSGRYTALSRWRVTEEGLVGEMTLPLAVGIVGGATRVHPSVRAALKLMKITTAQELAEAIAAIGLAQNLTALRALATEGIQSGHMRLHARNIALEAGASGQEIIKVAEEMNRQKRINADAAREFLAALRNS